MRIAHIYRILSVRPVFFLIGWVAICLTGGIIVGRQIQYSVVDRTLRSALQSTRSEQAVQMSSAFLRRLIFGIVSSLASSAGIRKSSISVAVCSGRKLLAVSPLLVRSTKSPDDLCRSDSAHMLRLSFFDPPVFVHIRYRFSLLEPWGLFLATLFMSGSGAALWQAGRRRREMGQATAMLERLRVIAGPVQTPTAPSRSRKDKWLVSTSRFFESEASRLRIEIEALRRRETEALIRGEIGEMVTQIAHDIRSPLAALSEVERDLLEFPEDTRLLLRSAIFRIKGIAENLLDENRQRNELISFQCIPSLVNEMVQEKQLQYRERPKIKIKANILKEHSDACAQVQAKRFARVLSNLIDNAVESFELAEGIVFVGVDVRNGWISIRISDKGKGIPPDVLPGLMTRGRTYGKKSGTGLGLHHAKISVESWGGQVIIDSDLEVGTTVTLTLPDVSSTGA